MALNRIIGQHEGGERGPLLIALGGIHGNENAGVRALDYILKMLEVEPITNPDFLFRGRITALLGNIEAYSRRMRFIEKDLNRIWTQGHIDDFRKSDPLPFHEASEMLELLEIIENEISTYQPDRIILLDIHTTSSHGGIFAIPGKSEGSLELATNLHAPVVDGMLHGISGTTAHYFTTENLGVPVDTVIFEAGQHDDPLSINRSIACVINCMRTIGCVDDKDVENIHDKILLEHAANLPMISQLLYAHIIAGDEDFKMLDGFNNFQKVHKGEELATDKNGLIRSPYSGRILMPLYQEQGSEGFFIITDNGIKGNYHNLI